MLTPSLRRVMGSRCANPGTQNPDRISLQINAVIYSTFTAELPVPPSQPRSIAHPIKLSIRLEHSRSEQSFSPGGQGPTSIKEEPIALARPTFLLRRRSTAFLMYGLGHRSSALRSVAATIVEELSGPVQTGDQSNDVSNDFDGGDADNHCSWTQL